MPSKHYSRYSLSDFLEDDSFVQWVLYPELKRNTLWESFLLTYPHQRKVFDKAISFITVYRHQEDFTNSSRKDHIWNEIQQSIREDKAVPSLGRTLIYRNVAAAIAFIIISGSILWYVLRANTTVSTSFGEVRTVVLPDKSTVILNANSAITFSSDWDDHSLREVWLKGEAYFDVIHLNLDTAKLAESERFIVHTEDIAIEVLGTRFNVKSRRDKTNIALLTGKIKIHLPIDSTGTKTNLIMRPGEYLEYEDNKILNRLTVEKPQQITAWVKHEFVFNDASLSDIIAILQDDYGYAIDVSDKSIMSMRIEGEISVTTIQELFETLEAALELQIEETNKIIKIKRK